MIYKSDKNVFLNSPSENYNLYVKLTLHKEYLLTFIKKNENCDTTSILF